MRHPLRFHAWNTVGRVLRTIGDALRWAQLRLYGWSGWTDAIADQHR